jgi:hypothetical protein
MALTLIKEDGSGKPDANSYADTSDGDSYFDGHLYATVWTGAITADKEKALVMATRLIDSQIQFNGIRAHDTQALQWPRESCFDPDKGDLFFVLSLRSLQSLVPNNIVPVPVINATCEMARELLALDRTASPPGEGILSTTTGSGATFSSTRYDKTDTRPIISHIAQAMLSKFGAPINERSGVVRLVRS